MSGEENDIWHRRKRKREEKKAREFRSTIANCGLISCWGIAILWIWFLASHEGLAQINSPDQVPDEWTFFNTMMIQFIFLGAVLVTILYLIYRLRSGRSKN